MGVLCVDGQLRTTRVLRIMEEWTVALTALYNLVFAYALFFRLIRSGHLHYEPSSSSVSGGLVPSFQPTFSPTAAPTFFNFGDVTEITVGGNLRAGSELIFYVFLWWVGENIQWYLTMKECYMLVRKDKDKDTDVYTRGKSLLFNKFLSGLTSFLTLIGSAGFVEQYMRSYAPNFALVRILGKILIALQIVLLVFLGYGCFSLLCIGSLLRNGVSKNPLLSPLLTIVFFAWDYFVSVACISHKWARYILCFPLHLYCCFWSVFTSFIIIDLNSFFQSYVVLVKMATCGLPYYLASCVIPVALLDQLIAVRATLYADAQWFIDKPGMYLRLQQALSIGFDCSSPRNLSALMPYYCDMNSTMFHSFVLGSTFDAALFCSVVVLFVMPASVFVSIAMSSALSPYSISMIGSALLHGSKVMGAMYLVTKISHAVIAFIKPLVLLYQKHKLRELRMLIDEMNEIALREWNVDVMLHLLAHWGAMLESLKPVSTSSVDAEANANPNNNSNNNPNPDIANNTAIVVRTSPPLPSPPPSSAAGVNYNPNRYDTANRSRTPPTAQEMFTLLQQIFAKYTETAEREKAVLLERKSVCAKRIFSIVEIVFDMSLDDLAVDASAADAAAKTNETDDGSSSNANPLHHNTIGETADSAQEPKNDPPPYV